ncbi:MAG TPA: hypothetical protein VIK31_09220 [Propionibacteriaceae bacterium]
MRRRRLPVLRLAELPRSELSWLARLRLLTRLNVARTRLTRLTRLTVRLLAWTRLPVGGLSRPAVRRLTRLTVPRGRPVRGLTRLTVLWLTELARIWLPICHGTSVGMNRSPAEGR